MVKKYTASSKIWKKVNTHLNAAALLSDIFNVNHIQEEDSVVTFISENEPQISRQNSRGNALALLSKMIDMDTFLNVIHKSYTTKDEDIFVYSKFDPTDQNTILFPIMERRIMDLIPEYCNALYKDMYDFRLTVDEGFHSIDLILKIEGKKWDDLMEDVSFMVLKEGNILDLCNYKIEHMIPFEQHVDDEILKQGEL